MADRRVLGILAGEDMPLPLLHRWAESAEVVLAADGGAERLRVVGVVPYATIGDLDSITPEARASQVDLIHDPDQYTSDCDKLLSLAERLGYGSITLASVEGDLLDHTLGTLSSAIASPLSVRLALRRGIGWVLKGEAERTVDCTIGTRVSLIPLTCATLASMSGVEWPFDTMALEPGGRTSLSNRATAGKIRVCQKAGASLLFVGFEDSRMPAWDDSDGGPR